MGIEQSRRDDLESLGYLLVYLLRGSLPWQQLRAKTKQEKYDAIKEKKMCTAIEDLCQNLPEEFPIYLKICRNYEYTQKPDYAALRKLFRDLFVCSGFEYDYMYDWLLPRHNQYKQGREEIKDEKSLELPPINKKANNKYKENLKLEVKNTNYFSRQLKKYTKDREEHKQGSAQRKFLIRKYPGNCPLYSKSVVTNAGVAFPCRGNFKRSVGTIRIEVGNCKFCFYL
eukprot:TRINITY_DN9423_c0_g1_i1.p1 TRINITY_DN9423_c0_g1~~TRINITY_DN9423_c0_g1_i1.p1  ORF type:complete len:227 (-),score=47.95 TRINITY_DN9423_c0_g1_i1:157-837(-)